MKTAEQLANLYLQTVGRNSKLLLNVPPTPEGLLHDTDVQRLTGMREQLHPWFETDLVRRDSVSLDGRVREVILTRPSPVAFVRLNEGIARGQHVARYRVEGFDGTRWVGLSEVTTVGYAKIDRVVETATVTRVRLTIDDVAGPAAPSVRINVYPPV